MTAAAPATAACARQPAAARDLHLSMVLRQDNEGDSDVPLHCPAPATAALAGSAATSARGCPHPRATRTRGRGCVGADAALTLASHRRATRLLASHRRATRPHSPAQLRVGADALVPPQQVAEEPPCRRRLPHSQLPSPAHVARPARPPDPPGPPDPAGPPGLKGRLGV